MDQELSKDADQSKALVILISQSGETADTLAALRLAKEEGIMTRPLSMWSEAALPVKGRQGVLHAAGPEISVATTKASSAQLAAMYCLAVQFAKVREKNHRRTVQLLYSSCGPSRKRCRKQLHPLRGLCCG